MAMETGRAYLHFLTREGLRWMVDMASNRPPTTKLVTDHSPFFFLFLSSFIGTDSSRWTLIGLRSREDAWMPESSYLWVVTDRPPASNLGAWMESDYNREERCGWTGKPWVLFCMSSDLKSDRASKSKSWSENIGKSEVRRDSSWS
jgi:hypothetical protein